MHYRTLGKTGIEVSVLSLGASSLGSVFRNIDEHEGIRTVHTALDLGVNLIDVAPYYGLTKAEAVLGKALKGIQRKNYILSTKAGRYGDDDFDFSESTIKKSVEESLKRLGTDYIDILHLHDIEFGSMDQILEESIPTLQILKKEGKIRFFGVSGLPLKIFKEVLTKSYVDSILSYCHYSLNNTKLIDFLHEMKDVNIGVINASPLSMGLLSKRGAPPWHPAGQEIKNVCEKAVSFCTENGIDIEKLAVQFSCSNNLIATTLVGTANPDNMIKNINWINEPIDLEVLKTVQDMLSPIKDKIWYSGKIENNI
ncbi:aldo/keto reductase [Neobacillus cucumis]|uniref:aldo/keto reductase n=1 Tax=Neobacillus cucumis TaxID=1740721 RepID=UPI00203B807D|nr:aldo/keto reductase [Neobacillus cucumis]MCM3729192.1 aldo/keto reductase [Neobacillus cucumis]